MSTLSRIGAVIAFGPFLVFLVVATMEALGSATPSGGCGLVAIVAITLPLGFCLWLAGLSVAPPKSGQDGSREQ